MPPANTYPTSPNSWLNPGPNTLEDAAGYEHDAVITQLQQHAAAIEAKLGTGSGGPPAGGSVLRRTGTGASGWGQVVGTDIAANTITGGNIAPTTIVGGNLVNNTIGNQQLGAAAVDIGNLVVRATQLVASVTVNSPSTSGTSLGKMNGSDLSVTATGKPGLMFLTMLGTGNAALSNGTLQVFEGGGAVLSMVNDQLTAGNYHLISGLFPYTPTAAAHAYELRWSITTGTWTANAVYFGFLEFRNAA